MLTTLLIDDDKMSLFALRSMLGHYCPDVEIIGECQNALKAPEMIFQLQPAICFLDLLMPGKNGIDMLEELRAHKFEIVVVTAHERYAIQALRLAASDFLLKPIDPVLLVESVGKVKNRLLRRSM